jgi:hypothetical protein
MAAVKAGWEGQISYFVETVTDVYPGVSLTWQSLALLVRVSSYVLGQPIEETAVRRVCCARCLAPLSVAAEDRSVAAEDRSVAAEDRKTEDSQWSAARTSVVERDKDDSLNKDKGALLALDRLRSLRRSVSPVW